jgi:hypothetical protein
MIGTLGFLIFMRRTLPRPDERAPQTEEAGVKGQIALSSNSEN